MKVISKNKTPGISERKLGVLLVVVSAIVFSAAGVFTKAAETGAWEVIFWRGFFAALFTTLYIMWRGKFRSEYLEMGKSGLAVGVIGASATAAFLTAFKITTIANVILIFASAPLFAALLAWLAIREKISRVTLLACATGFLGVVVIVQGSLGAGNIKGDLLALWMTIGMSILMVIYRIWPDTPAAGPAALSSILLLPVGAVFGSVAAISRFDFVLLAAFGIFFAVASVTFSEGVKRIAAGEAALLSTLETPMAPVLGWLFFREVPASTTIIGGGIIFAAVISSQLFAPQNDQEE